MSERPLTPLPTTIEEIDAAWLTTALRTGAPDICVKDFEIVQVINGTCTKIRILLKFAGESTGIPEHVVLKGGFEPHSREMHLMLENEVRGYRDVASALPLPSPGCYFAHYDPDARQGIIIMDDLLARGVKFCDALVPQSHEEVARRLSVLAGFHATTWDSPEFAPGGRWDWLEPICAKSSTYLDYFLQPEQWDYFASLPRGAAVSTRFLDSGWMREALEKLAILEAQLPLAVLHADTHLGNLYVDIDGTPSFFDIISHKGPVMAEVSYHVACALDTGDRRRWEGALVQHYLDELRSHGVEAPAFDDAMRHYGANLARGYCIFLINDAVFQKEAINTAYTARFNAAMLDNQTTALLDAIG